MGDFGLRRETQSSIAAVPTAMMKHFRRGRTHMGIGGPQTKPRTTEPTNRVPAAGKQVSSVSSVSSASERELAAVGAPSRAHDDLYPVRATRAAPGAARLSRPRVSFVVFSLSQGVRIPLGSFDSGRRTERRPFRSQAAPSSSPVQDTTLSRWERGFKSRWGHCCTARRRAARVRYIRGILRGFHPARRRVWSRHAVRNRPPWHC